MKSQENFDAVAPPKKLKGTNKQHFCGSACIILLSRRLYGLLIGYEMSDNSGKG